MAKKKVKKAARQENVRLAIIGGSGLYTMPGLRAAREVRANTPFGVPSDAIVIGSLEGQRVAFLARHGRGHRITPSEINYRANIYALKQLGVERIISVSAVGSLKEELPPMEFLVPDQFYDRTKGRASTFFGGGIVANVKVHRGGTYVCIEGPQFSTLAEAHVHRQLRFDVIGMTNVTEAKLAREAGICYATIAMITDYDCWHPEHESVTATQIIATLSQNAENAQKVLRTAVRELPVSRSCKCGSALQHALVTDLRIVPKATKKRLGAIIEKYNS